MQQLDTQVLIIGGGATGTSLARDLALRGVACLLVEREDLNAGASGRNHGLLHSGARYVSNDPEAARECRLEGEVLRRIAPRCIEDTGGLFVALEGDDERFVADFPLHCARAGIEVRPLSVAEAREMEPCLSPHAVAAYGVPDASVDPFRFSLETMADAVGHGAKLLRHTEVTGLLRAGRRVVGATLRNRLTGEEQRVTANVVVSAAGAWAREIARMAGLDLPMLFSKGTLVVANTRLAHRVLNRLRKPSDADIVMPGGTVSIVGTTSVTIPDLSDVRPTVAEVDRILDEASQLVPALAHTRCIRAYAGVRPLVAAGHPSSGGPTQADGRAVSRGFTLIDHEAEGVPGLVTITGGKLTTARLMAERTADLVCQRLGHPAPCRTRDVPLQAAPGCEWTFAGTGPRTWMAQHNPSDVLVCECEMVQQSALDEISASLGPSGSALLLDLAARSRLGKGACQGTFCSLRMAAHLYERELLRGAEGLEATLAFFRERWRGLRPVVFGEQLSQAELFQAIHVGLLGLELVAPARVSEGVPRVAKDPSKP